MNDQESGLSLLAPPAAIKSTNSNTQHHWRRRWQSRSKGGLNYKVSSSNGSELVDGTVFAPSASAMAGVVVCDDVIAEILAKLPVKSLLRLNCVCKTWYSVISDPQFSNSLHRMRPCVLVCENLRKFSTITIESLPRIKNRAFTPLSLPWEKEPDDYGKNLFLGSCNGLVCVDHKNKSSRDKSGLILWNPSTRKFRRLPRPGCYSVQDGLWTYAWFGYDELIDDYKLVWLNCNRRPPKVTELDVFTLKSNTWRRPPVDQIPDSGIGICLLKRQYKSIGVLSNGAIHWLICYNPPSGGSKEVCILALDLATEKHRLLKFSHAPVGFTPWVGSLLGGCLSLCTITYENGYRVKDLWVMKEYGVESSWTKLLSINLTLNRPSLFLGFSLILLSKEEGKEIVAMCDGVCEQSGGADRGVIVKLRVEGGKKVRFEETLLYVPMHLEEIFEFQNNVVQHMEESLVSLSAD